MLLREAIEQKRSLIDAARDLHDLTLVQRFDGRGRPRGVALRLNYERRV